MFLHQNQLLARGLHLQITAVHTSNKLHGIECVDMLCLHFDCQLTGIVLLNWIVLIDNRLQNAVFFLLKMIDLGICTNSFVAGKIFQAMIYNESTNLFLNWEVLTRLRI